jgi:hypothetical protein
MQSAQSFFAKGTAPDAAPTAIKVGTECNHLSDVNPNQANSRAPTITLVDAASCRSASPGLASPVPTPRRQARRLRRLKLQHRAAVDDPSNTRHIARKRARHEDDHIGHLLHLGDAAHGDNALHHLPQLLAARDCRVHHGRLDPAGADCVDADAVLCEVQRGVLGHAQHRVLARRVLRYVGGCDVARAGPEVDDDAAADVARAPARGRLLPVLRDHGRGHGLDRVERAHDVDAPEAVHLVEVDVLDRRRLLDADAGAVDAVVYASEGLDGGSHHGVDAAGVRHVYGQRERAEAGVGRQLLALARGLLGGAEVEVRRDEAARSIGGVCERDFPADAAALIQSS